MQSQNFYRVSFGSVSGIHLKRFSYLMHTFLIRKLSESIPVSANSIGIQMGQVEKRGIRVVDGYEGALSQQLEMLKEKGMDVVFVVLDPNSRYGVLVMLILTFVPYFQEGKIEKCIINSFFLANLYNPFMRSLVGE